MPNPFYTEGYAAGVDGTRLWWRVVGQAAPGTPTLVLNDGIGCDGYAWKYLIEHFVSDHRILHWNYRGHGLSEKPRDRGVVGIVDVSEDLVRVLDAAKIAEKVVLVGHSFGVQVILETHRRHPERVLALIPVCGSYGTPIDTFHDNGAMKLVFPTLRRLIVENPRAAQILWGLMLLPEVALEVASRTEANGDLLKRQDFRPYFDHIRNMDVTLFFDMLADAADHSAKDHLARIDVPTLLIAGEKDSFTPGRLSEEMHRAIPASELLIIPKGTHTAPIEMPDLFCLRVEKFLKQRVRPLLATSAAPPVAKAG